ncbi:MAG: transporter associated domain-containing protein, partial [Ruthenibacterium sp.]
VQERGFSRIPVYRKSMDDIVGILYAKDLFALWNGAKADCAVSAFMRPAMFVPEACRARELLIEFKVKHTQIAVVVDEYGGTSGLVTMEDILEEIVGNIQDEFDDEEEDIVRCPDGLIAAGNADLEDVFDALSVDIPEEMEDENFDSVGGLVIDRFGRIPASGEEVAISYSRILFTVLEVDDRRVAKVKCTVIADV